MLRRQPEPAAVQSVLFAVAVTGVTDQGMTCTGQMSADLVHAPGQWSCFEQRCSRGGMAGVRPGKLEPCEAGDERRGGSGILEFTIQGQVLFFDPSSCQRDVGFLYRAFPELERESSCRLLCEGKQENPRSGPIQAVDGVEVHAELPGDHLEADL